MTLAHRLTSQLTGLTRSQVAAMAPADRQRLGDQCRRVLGMTEGERIVDDAREATAPRAGVLARLKDGERST